MKKLLSLVFIMAVLLSGCEKTYPYTYPPSISNSFLVVGKTVSEIDFSDPDITAAYEKVLAWNQIRYTMKDYKNQTKKLKESFPEIPEEYMTAVINEINEVAKKKIETEYRETVIKIAIKNDDAIVMTGYVVYQVTKGDEETLQAIAENNPDMQLVAEREWKLTQNNDGSYVLKEIR